MQGYQLLCYSLVSTTKQKGVPCYSYYNTRHALSSISFHYADKYGVFKVAVKYKDKQTVYLPLEAAL